MSLLPPIHKGPHFYCIDGDWVRVRDAAGEVSFKTAQEAVAAGQAHLARNPALTEVVIWEARPSKRIKKTTSIELSDVRGGSQEYA